MDYAARVGVVERFTYLRDDRTCLRQRRAMQSIGQGSAAEEWHDQISVTVCLTKIEDGQDMRVLQLCQDARFLLKAQDELRVLFSQMARQHLQGHMTIHAGLMGLEDRGHPALAQLGN